MSSADHEIDRVGELIERLLADPAFRSEFRANPLAVCRAHGLESLAAELSTGGNAMQTLELRESRSSLAGVVMAVAAEGVGVVELRGLLGHRGLHGPARAAAVKALKAGGVSPRSGRAATLEAMAQRERASARPSTGAPATAPVPAQPSGSAPAAASAPQAAAAAPPRA